MGSSAAGRNVSGKRISQALCAAAAAVGDWVVLALAGIGLQVLSIANGDAGPSLTLPVATALIAATAAHWLGLYAHTALRSPLRNLPRLLAAWTLAMGVPLLVETHGSVALPTSTFPLWFVAGGFCLVNFRLGLAAALDVWARQGRLERHVAIYGSGPTCQALIEALKADRTADARVCGIFDDRNSGRAGPVAGYPILGGAEELAAFARQASIDLVIIAVPISAEERLLQLLDQLSALPIDIRVAGNASKLRLHPRAYSWLGNIPLIDLSDKPLTDWDVFVKGTFDRVMALLALMALAPLMALIAVAVKLESRGPVLFRQQRLGFNNQLIEILKFRSMHIAQCDADASRLVTKGDPRVTRLGAFLRRTSLDELPQFINVLRGDLSLVGPRPHALLAKAADHLYQDAVDGYFTRHKVKPGITGWAQINGWRGETDTQEKIRKRVEYDIYYIENWSLLFDISILLKTPMALLKTDNAY
ncbi:MAG: undecaprenyl-phosphate glucose phosphotransferase [Sphingomonadales bacterium]|nr:undecaprenyl-phosphate glucose phosphotransferase [Sphingomonadales bacterium]